MLTFFIREFCTSVCNIFLPARVLKVLVAIVLGAFLCLATASAFLGPEKVQSVALFPAALTLGTWVLYLAIVALYGLLEASGSVRRHPTYREYRHHLEDLQRRSAKRSWGMAAGSLILGGIWISGATPYALAMSVLLAVGMFGLSIADRLRAAGKLRANERRSRAIMEAL